MSKTGIRREIRKKSAFEARTGKWFQSMETRKDGRRKVKMTHIEELFEFDLSHNKIVIGTDEAGRGPAAGGVFASAVCFTKKNEDLIEKLSILNDSKQLSKKKRESLYDIILSETVNSTVCVEVDEIEEINILNSSLKAMKLACEEVIEKLSAQGTFKSNTTIQNNTAEHDLKLSNNIITLIDGNKLIKNYTFPQKFIIKGDSKSASIAAASILAKVTRDRYMEKLDLEFPQYHWAKNAGYLTQEHLDAIDKYGLCKYHRPSFLKKHFEKQLSLF